MKSSFNFLQIANWLYVCKENILNIREQVKAGEITKQQAIELLKIEKRRVSVVKSVLERKATIHGVSQTFLRKLKEIKKQYGLE